MAKRRTKDTGSLYQKRTEYPIPDGWRIRCDEKGRRYAEGDRAFRGSRRYPLNSAGDRVLVPEGVWIAQWYDHAGAKHRRSTRTTDKALASQILAGHVKAATERREGIIDVTADGYARNERVPLSVHVAAYLAHCERAEQAPKAIKEKRRHLNRLLAETGAARLSQLTIDALEQNLGAMKLAKRSARTINFRRQTAVAFMNWARRTGRVLSNPLTIVPKLDEQRDRRRVRRPLTDDELARLLAVAGERGRAEWYLAAALAGLRKGDLQRLTWSDVDFETETLTVREGKAKRVDVLPMHPQLATALRALRDRTLALPAARVFPTTVTDATRLKDFLRAGLAREEVVLGPDGEPIMVGKRKPRPKTKIVTTDDEGRVIDLHALRTTLGTMLARAGVAPQIAQRIMRHETYETTLRHYTILGLTDTSRAMDALPGIPAVEAADLATGADGGGCTSGCMGRDPVPNDATRHPGLRDDRRGARHRKPHDSKAERDEVQTGAESCEVERTGLEPATSSLQSWHSTN